MVVVRGFGSALLVVALLVGGSVLVGSASAQTSGAPDCMTVEYSENDDEEFEVATLRELQCMGHEDTETSLDDDFVQVIDINASETAQWNDGAGFEPIGGRTPFNGSLDGSGFHITGLTINRSSDAVGLFGELGRAGGTTDLSLVDASITGSADVGSVAGENRGAIIRTTASGSVAGQSGVGGVAGVNEGTIERTHSTADVSGNSQVGGLVGDNNGTVHETYAAGRVLGLDESGGLVGSNTGQVEASYWDVNATGQQSSEGGTGLTTREMTGSTATETMGGFEFATGWEVGGSGNYPQLRPQSGDTLSLSEFRPSSENLLETLTMVDFAVGGGSGILMTVALYRLANQSRRGGRRAGDETVGGDSAGTDETSPGQSDGVADVEHTPEAQLDSRIDDIKRKIQAAKVPYEKEKHERALDLCDEALLTAESALDTARAEHPYRASDVERLHDKATELRMRIWTEWREEQNSTSSGVQILDTDSQPDDSSGTTGPTPDDSADQSRAGADPPTGDEPPTDDPDSPADESLFGDSGDSDAIEWHDQEESGEQ